MKAKREILQPDTFAMHVMVSRDEQYCHILFLKPGAMEALTQPDTDAFDLVLYNLAHQLIHMEASQALHRNMSDYSHGLDEESRGVIVSEIVIHALNDYLILRRLRAVGYLAGGEADDLFNSLQRLLSTIDVTSNFLSENNIKLDNQDETDTSFHNRAGLAREAFIAACNYIAVDPDLTVSKAINWPDWLYLLSLELDSLYQSYGNWKDSEAVVRLERHYERLSWGLFVVLREKGDSLRYQLGSGISNPYDEIKSTMASQVGSLTIGRELTFEALKGFQG